MPDDGTPRRPGSQAAAWARMAERNRDEWRVQDVDTVLLAIQEELGEVTQAYLTTEAEDGDPTRIYTAIDDLAPLLWQLQWAVTRQYQDIGSDTDGDHSRHPINSR